MKYRYSSSMGDKASVGAVIGVIAGGVGATVATFWGGYELGSAINDALHLTNTIGRGALDLVVMGLVAGPAYSIGLYGGMVAGGAIGAVAHPVIEKTKDIGELVSRVYKKITDKKSDEPTDKYLQ